MVASSSWGWRRSLGNDGLVSFDIDDNVKLVDMFLMVAKIKMAEGSFVMKDEDDVDDELERFDRVALDLSR